MTDLSKLKIASFGSQSTSLVVQLNKSILIQYILYTQNVTVFENPSPLPPGQAFVIPRDWLSASCTFDGVENPADEAIGVGSNANGILTPNGVLVPVNRTVSLIEFFANQSNTDLLQTANVYSSLTYLRINRSQACTLFYTDV